MPLRASSSRSSQPSIELVAGAGRPVAPRAAAASRGCIVDARERPLPRLGSAKRLAGDFDVRARAPSLTPGRAARQQDIRSPSGFDRRRAVRPRYQLGVEDACPPGSRLAQDPRFDDLAVLDQRGAGLADARARSATQAIGYPADFQQHAASRPAAGRRRWNSCRRCGGHRPRHSPGAHSRRPCRAIRRGRRNSRFPRR